jgi:hypothetical protein
MSLLKVRHAFLLTLVPAFEALIAVTLLDHGGGRRST